jgi:two-component system nitrogen regulation response regulator NtrX
MEKAKILCIAHTPADRNILCGMLRESGYDAVPAASGAEALKIVQQQPVHGVLLEYDLPDNSGATVREQIIQLFPDLPVLLFSGVGQHTPFLLRFLYQYVH